MVWNGSLTTDDLLEAECRLLHHMDHLASRPGNTLHDWEVERVRQKFPSLSEEQVRFVRHLTLTKSAVRIGLGLAGTGKTHALRACVDAWKRRGFRMLMAAPTGQAAGVLAKATDTEGETLTNCWGISGSRFRRRSNTTSGNSPESSVAEELGDFASRNRSRSHPSPPGNMMTSSLTRTIAAYLKPLGLAEELTQAAIQDLDTMGLLPGLHGSLNTMMSAHGAVELSSRLKDFGRRFADFISLPPEVTDSK